MSEPKPVGPHPGVPFERKFFDAEADFMTIGAAAVGGKAQGLAFVSTILESDFERAAFPDFSVAIPRMAVLATDVFDLFMERNGLREVAGSDLPDDRIAHAFLKAEFPTEYLGDLRALISKINQPLAIRSSSLLEDALHHPFAGVYGTKMIPNNQPDISSRFQRLIEAIKFVYASTFFREAKAYISATNCRPEDEKMAVIIQEVVGRRSGDRFYPAISGVGRSFNYYPVGKIRPADGVVNLALGLGKTIVDGGRCWSYSPAFPRANPPYGSPRDLLKLTQVDFFAVNMGKPPAYDPIRESEFLVQSGLEEAESDGNLKLIAATYDGASDRVVPGIGQPGPRIINFAPILLYEQLPLNNLVRHLLELSREKVGAEVEIEFAVDIDPQRKEPARLGFLQVRSQASSTSKVTIDQAALAAREIVVYSETVLGNGEIDNIHDIVYVRPELFAARHSPAVAAEIEELNRIMVAAARPYLLIGFGRWGSSDPWLGIPVNWGQISAARVIVEATLPEMNVEPSQGSHFFHNLTSFSVPYFSVAHGSRTARINWPWLEHQAVVSESRFVRLVHSDQPLTVQVDGLQGLGVIHHG
ncbi:MAG: PEP/pyruvate-binding domain-containing protein [Candidatus Neomarinimicrobiota bacterium]